MKTEISRRDFVAALAALPVAAQAQKPPVPIIDVHIHLFDRNRPQGVPWPPPGDLAPGVSALPPRYRSLAEPFGIVGAIVVEASPWLDDNQWVLDQAATDSMMVGTVGYLHPGRPEFGQQLERLHKNPLYLGIRYSDDKRPERNVNLAEVVKKREFISDIKLLADAGLTLDSNLPPDPTVLLELTERVPSLRLTIPHLPNARRPTDRAALDRFMGSIKELGQRPQVFIKLTAIIRRVDGKPVTDITAYRDWLDQLWDTFGENRVIFGSDWPNSERQATFPDVMTVVRAYLTSKGAAAEKVFWRNSVAVYRWKRRDSNQPQL